jgi:hypothetical protein
MTELRHSFSLPLQHPIIFIMTTKRGKKKTNKKPHLKTTNLSFLFVTLMVKYCRYTELDIYFIFSASKRQGKLQVCYFVFVVCCFHGEKKETNNGQQAVSSPCQSVRCPLLNLSLAFVFQVLENLVKAPL